MTQPSGNPGQLRRHALALLRADEMGDLDAARRAVLGALSALWGMALPPPDVLQTDQDQARPGLRVSTPRRGRPADEKG